MGEAHALKYVEANISPSVLYGTELVREVGAAEKLDKVWEMAVAEGTLVGDANVWHSAEARIRRGGLRWHSQELPWSKQRQARQAGMVGKLARSGAGPPGAIATTLRKVQGMCGYADPFLAAGKNTLRVAGLAERRPTGAGADGVWKKALKRVMVRDHMKDLQGVKAHASGDRSDCLMLATLGGKGGQAQKWEASVPDMGVRVKLHKIKLGVVGCTKVAKSHQLSVAGKWGKMSKAEQTAFLRCPCGAAKQSFAHVLKECPVAKGVLEAGMGHVGGDTPFEKFADVLTMRGEGLGPGSDQEISQIITNIAALEDVL